MNIFSKSDFSLYVLAADIGALIPINYINISILTKGGIVLFENNPLIIAVEVVGTLALTTLNVAWLLNKFKVLARKKPTRPLENKP
jgi:hypothetical protein